MFLVTSLFRWERSVSPRENKWCVTWIYFGVVHIEEKIWDKWCVYDVESRGLKILYCSSHYSHCFHEHGVRLVNSKHKCIFDFSKFLFRYVSSFNLQFSPTEIGWKFPFFSSLNKTGNLGQKLKAKKTALLQEVTYLHFTNDRSSRHCLHFSVPNKSFDTPLTTRIANLHFRKC